MSRKMLFFFRRFGCQVWMSALPALLLVACADFVDVGTPKTEVTGPAVYEDDVTATAAVVGIYAKMSEAAYFNNVGIAVLTGNSADELENGLSGLYGDFEANQLHPADNELLITLWQPGYKFIYYANIILERLELSNGVSAPVRQSLQGQAHFVRALCYFYLVNLFGDLPKVTGTDYDINARLARVPADTIYALIEDDLAKAVDLLPHDFETAYEGERTLPTKWAAHALSARVALYRGQWAKAVSQVDNVINQKGLFGLADVGTAFKYTSSEAIWQIKPIYISGGAGTQEAAIFNLFYATFSFLRPSILEAFEENDQRRQQWIGETTYDGVETVYLPTKYRFVDINTTPDEEMEYHIEFRLAEQYLIRAEARTHLGDFEGAVADLDTIRDRAGLPRLADMGITWTRDLILARVMQERRVELFAEGHRWFDLIRTGQARAFLEDISGKMWDDTDILYPVPASEIRKNRFLEPQNDGY